MTCRRRTLVNPLLFSSRLFKAFDGIFINAEFLGANTVNGPPVARVSTRSAATTAVTNVFNDGFVIAAWTMLQKIELHYFKNIFESCLFRIIIIYALIIIYSEYCLRFNNYLGYTVLSYFIPPYENLKDEHNNTTIISNFDEYIFIDLKYVVLNSSRIF